MLNAQLADCIKVGLCLFMPSWLMRSIILLSLALGLQVNVALAIGQAEIQPSTPSQPVWSTGPDTFAMFEDFLVTVYPEFKASDNYKFAVSDSHRSDHERYYSLRLITYHRPEAEQRVPINKSHNHSRQVPCAPDPWTEGEEVMQSSITYSESFHRILGFTNISDYANGSKLLNAEEEVRRHLQWTNEQIADYLRTLGAKYGPWNKDELVKKIPLDQLAPFLGKLTLVSVQFVNVVPQGNVGGGPHAILLWKAVVSTHDPQVGEIQWALHFEPFEGKLHSIVPIQRTAQ